MKKVYYFDTLPIRFRPQRLESLTSYLTRIADANKIQNITELSALFFESFNMIRQMMDLADYPLLSFKNMPKATGCSVPKLLKTTFYHLGRKFGRSISLLRNDYFLVGSIATHLRYCPACLSENPYYSLTWRFSTLLGCAKHKCRLLEYCGHCGKSLSLFPSPIKMHACSFCENDLQTCQSEPLTTKELQVTSRHLQDLEFLLSPNACEKDEALTKRIGYYFLNQRTPKVITSRMVARTIGINPPLRKSYEQTNVKRKRRGTKLLNYINYANQIGYKMERMYYSMAMFN